MLLDKIITLANNKTRLRFVAMERSLRATGCKLPLWVIPYDDNLFDLPEGAVWWQDAPFFDWLKAQHAHPLMRKYLCFTVGNYQFVDADVIFLKNPEMELEPHIGFVASCGHWRNSYHTTTVESQKLMLDKSTMWQRHVFNSGQYACDRAILDMEALKNTLIEPERIDTYLRKDYDQPGINWLVWSSDVPWKNLTQAPDCMESTWAGDYPGEYEHYWKSAQYKPYLIHWAGTSMDVPRPINQLFYNLLTAEEKSDWDGQVKNWAHDQKRKRRSLRALARRVRAICRAAKQAATS